LLVALPEERPLRLAPDDRADVRVVRPPLPVELFVPPVACVVPERVPPEDCELPLEVLRRELLRADPRDDDALRPDDDVLRPVAWLDDLLLVLFVDDFLPVDFEREALLDLRPDFFVVDVFEPVRLVVLRLMSASEFCAHPRRVLVIPKT